MMLISDAFPPTRHAGPIANPGEAEQIARALKARRSGKSWLAKCPGHDDRNASLSISEGEDGTLLLNCFAGCEFKDIKDILQDSGIIGTDRRDRARRTLAYIKPVPTEHEPDARAARLWNNSVPPQGTPVQTYLERRGIPIIPLSLRYHADARAMLAGFQRPDGKLVGAQSTALTLSGEKASADARRTFADMRDGAVRLAAAAEVMGLTEGTETGLSAMVMSGVPVWVALGGRMAEVALPELVREVHIFGDNDPPGRVAAQRAADVHLKAGRRVKLWFPPDGINDFNDLLIALADCDGDDDRLLANLAGASRIVGNAA
jgi:putative DNA primase/helicase